MSAEFWITSLIVVASPGVGALYTIAAGLSQGGRASVIAALACTLGIVPHLVAAVLGLATLMHASALLYDAVKYAGVAYLLWMAWHSLREHGALKVETGRAARAPLKVMVEGILINLLNPKLTIFFVAFLPQFMSKDAVNPLGEMLVLSGIFMAQTFVVFMTYGVFAAAMREHVISRPDVMTWLRCSFAAAFVALGVKLAVQER